MLAGLAPFASVVPMHAEVSPATKSMVKGILGIVFDIATIVGIILLVWSIFQLVMAFKNEDADSKSRAIIVIVVSVTLIGLNPLLQAIAKTSGSPLNGYI